MMFNYMNPDTTMRTAGLAAAGSISMLNGTNTLVNGHSYGYGDSNGYDKNYDNSYGYGGRISYDNTYGYGGSNGYDTSYDNSYGKSYGYFYSKGYDNDNGYGNRTKQT